MQKQQIWSQLNNELSVNLYVIQCTSIAENVFTIKNLPKFIDEGYVNSHLLRRGSIAYFYEEELGTLLALPYVDLSGLDVYGRVGGSIQVMGSNGYTRKLNKSEYVIMYDNNTKNNIYSSVLQYAYRLALCQRTIDINIWQQKTPRIWKVPNEMLNSVKDAISKIDSFQEAIVNYDGIDFNELNAVLSDVPFVADKISEQKDKLWNEFLRFVGVANISYQKKERNISDEITAMQGGTVVSRFDRYKPRLKAIEEINEKFADYLPDGNLELEYYDGVPSSVNDNEYIEGGNNNVSLL